MNCKECGAPLKQGELYCSRCGTKIGKQDNDKTIIFAALCAAVGIVIVFSLIIGFLIIKPKQKLDKSDGFGIKPESVATASSQPIEESVSEKPTVTPTPIAAPVFSTVDASSFRGSDTDDYGNVYYYNPENVLDGNYATCWASDIKYGLTPSITLRSSTPQRVSGVRFSNGYFRTEDTYRRNRRITKLRISYQGGSKEVTCSIDQYRQMQTVSFDTPVDTNYITFQILDSKYGDWNDISISEIEVY